MLAEPVVAHPAAPVERATVTSLPERTPAAAQLRCSVDGRCEFTTSKRNALTMHERCPHDPDTGQAIPWAQRQHRRPARPHTQTDRRVAERAETIKARARAEAAPLDRTVTIPLDQLVARPGDEIELGTVELRALTTADGRMRVVARFVPDEAETL